MSSTASTTATTTSTSTSDATQPQPTLEELILENAQLREKVRSQEATIASLSNTAEQRRIIIQELRETCEHLGAQVVLDEPIKKKVTWLKSALKLMKPSDREVSGQLGTMSDAEFEKSLGAAKNVACFRYAMRRVETNLSDDALFQLVKGYPHKGNELKTFTRKIRIGEFLIKLTFAYHKKFSGSEMSALLRSRTLPIKSLTELNSLSEWVSTEKSASTVQDYLHQNFLAVPGVPFAIAEILKDLGPSKSVTPSSAENADESPVYDSESDGPSNSVKKPKRRITQRTQAQKKKKQN